MGSRKHFLLPFTFPVDSRGSPLPSLPSQQWLSSQIIAIFPKVRLGVGWALSPQSSVSSSQGLKAVEFTGPSANNPMSHPAVLLPACSSGLPDPQSLADHSGSVGASLLGPHSGNLANPLLLSALPSVLSYHWLQSNFIQMEASRSVELFASCLLCLLSFLWSVLESKSWKEKKKQINTTEKRKHLWLWGKVTWWA